MSQSLETDVLSTTVVLAMPLIEVVGNDAVSNPDLNFNPRLDSKIIGTLTMPIKEIIWKNGEPTSTYGVEYLTKEGP